MAQSRARQKKKHYLEFLEKYNGELVTKNATLECQLATLAAENAILKKNMDKCICSQNKITTLITIPAHVATPIAKDLYAEKARCFYASFPESSQTHSSLDAYSFEPTPQTDGGFLRKPFKKRVIPPKLNINCDTHSIISKSQSS